MRPWIRPTPKTKSKTQKAIKPAERGRIHTFLSTSPVHMKYKLQMEAAQVYEMVISSVTRARNHTDDVEWSAEDATRTEHDFLCRCVEAAIKAGATTINIPDTVGYAIPSEFGALVGRAVSLVGEQATISVHCHNDLGLATANTLAAVQAGARQVEVTINGLGERAGNASLEEVVMALRTRPAQFPTMASRIQTEQITPASRLVSYLTGFAIQPNKAIVGGNAFAHESGIHQDGVLKDRSTFEIMDPASIGIDDANQLVLGSATAPQTVFIVNRPTQITTLNGIWGWLANDRGIRQSSGTTWQQAGASNVNDFNFTIEPFYGGTLFKQGTELEAIARGNLEMSITSAQELATIIPAWSIFTAGYLLRDAEHQKKVFASDIVKDLYKSVEDKLGVKLEGTDVASKNVAAVIVTAPIIPQMFETGALHLLLSKPISRSLLLVSKSEGSERTMASRARVSSSALTPSRTISSDSEVELVEAPAMIVASGPTARRTARHTSTCSSMLSVGVSPVVPVSTSPSEPEASSSFASVPACS